MEQYYDAFVYVANWGSHEFMLRLPRTLLDPETAAHYCVEAPVATAHTTGEHVILSFSSVGRARHPRSRPPRRV